MPQFDGNGPAWGGGLGAGRGMGPCGAGASGQRGRDWGRGQGYGCGLGRYGGGGNFCANYQPSREDEMKVLKEEKQMLEEELVEIKKREEQLKSK
ncbi:MAG: DUF5320 domain-containing protein [Patescibacteria group bacterium]